MKDKQYLINMTQDEIINHLNNKEKVFVKGTKEYYQKIGDVLCMFNGNDELIIYNAALCCYNDDFYFIEETKFKVEIGKFYENLNNHKCYVYKVHDGDLYCAKVLDTVEDITYTVTSEGKYNISRNASAYDLIGEWEDEI